MKQTLLCLPEHFTLHATALIHLIHRDRGPVVRSDRPSRLQRMRPRPGLFILDESAMPPVRTELPTKG